MYMSDENSEESPAPLHIDIKRPSCMGEGRLGPPSTLDLSHLADRRYENRPMIIGTDTGATCDVTWDMVNTFPRGAVLTIERFETWHWWKIQTKERNAKIIPTTTIKIPIAIKQVVRTTRCREARCCAALSVDESPCACGVDEGPL
jgi:asparagine synthetase B (glutamine-hydrolysing)